MTSRQSATAALLLACIASATQAAPTIRNVDIRGLQIGGTTRITIDGADLLPDPRLLMTVPIAGQKLLPKSTATRVELEVTLGEKVEPGLYNLRMTTVNGVSGAIVVAVDGLAQQPMADKIKSLPVALHGTISGSQQLKTTFPGKAGQELICEVEAQRLGGKLRPVLHLHGPDGRQLAWSLPSPRLRGDARVEVKLPQDGQYTLALHDLQYAAPAPNHFRLKIGRWDYADLAFPPAVGRAKSTEVELIGRDGESLRAPFLSRANSRFEPAAWPAGKLFSGMRPAVRVSELPEFIEQQSDKDQALHAVPAAVSGRLSTKAEEDRYRVPVQAGSKLRFEVFAARIGSPVDAVLELRKEDGARLASNDDAPGTADSRLDYTVPNGANSVVAVVKDAHGRGGRTCIYRLVVSPLDAKSTPQDDFDLSIQTDRINLPLGGRHIVKVVAARRGYQGPVKFSLDGLPPGIEVENADIPDQADGTLISLVAMKPDDSPQVFRLFSTVNHVKRALIRCAQFKSHPLGDLQPWLGEEIAVAVTPASKPALTLDWGEVASDARLVLSGKLKVPIRCTRPADHDGPVRLSLMTSQNPPQANNRDDPNRTLRRESGQPVEIPTGKNEAEFTALVPAVLAKLPYRLAFRGELLSKDKKQVLAEAYTPVRVFNTLNPIFVQLAGPAEVTATLDSKTGAVVKLAGKVNRLAGFTGDVTVSLQGLPGGIAVPRAVLKKDQTDFKLDLKFPANFKPADIKGIKLFATGKSNPRAPLLVRSEDVAVQIKVLPKPAKAKS